MIRSEARAEPVAGQGEMLLGLAASSGIARGEAVICRCDEAVVVPRRSVESAELPGELERFEIAVCRAEVQLRALENEVREKSGPAEAAIFEAQTQMLNDPMLRREVATRCLRGRINIEAAVSDAAEKLVAAFQAIDDPVFRERAGDLQDVARRLLGLLLDRADRDMGELPAGSIIVARELLPSLAAGFGGNRIRALIAERGGATAHAVILARSMGIPVVIHVENASEKIKAGDPLIVDGVAGRVFIRPSAQVRREYDRLEADLAVRTRSLQELVDVPAVTQDGVTISLSANVGKVADAQSAAAFAADGIGLYRTEFAFIVHPGFPTEEQQLQIYRSAAEQMKLRPVVIRVLDIGSDKLLPYFPLPPEANPSLGRRGTRLLLGHPEILRTQLRAILRLSATHPVSVLFPMIGGLDEFRAARQALESAKADLESDHQSFDPDIPVGAMIETPSAAITAHAIARDADFLSIGTNDLVQYLLTTDRTSMEGYYDPLHPAVIQALKLVIDAAAAAGKPVSLCGEIAGNPSYTELLLGLGLRSLSVTPREILEIKRVVRSVNLDAARALAARALAATTIPEIKALVTGRMLPDNETIFQRRALQRWRWEGGGGP